MIKFIIYLIFIFQKELGKNLFMKTNYYIYIFLVFLVAHTNIMFAQQNMGKSYALLIAINEYQGNWETLKNPVRDAETLKKLLLKKYGFSVVKTLYNRAANRESIIKQTEALCNQVDSKDNLLIFFSGHGLDDGKEGYWIPFNAMSKTNLNRFISNDLIKQSIKNTVARHALVLSDASFTEPVFRSSSFSLENDGTPEFYQRVGKRASRMVLTSGSSSSITNDNVHSVFMQHILKYLEENQLPLITPSDLFEAIELPVAANTSKIPKLGHLHNTGHEGGQFIFQVNNTNPPCRLDLVIEEGTEVFFNENGGVLHAFSNKPHVVYEWLDKDGIMLGTGKEFRVITAGNYKLVAKTAEDCVKEAHVKVNMRMPKGEVSIIEGNEVEFTYQGVLNARTSSPNVRYEWRFNNFIVGTEPSLIVKKTGTYTLLVKSIGGKTISSANTKVSIKPRIHVVRIGDNLRRLSREYYGTPDKADLIFQANRAAVDNPEVLRVGRRLIIPNNDMANDPSKSELVKIAANIALPPFSQPTLFKKGMLTDVVQSVFKRMNQPVKLSFMESNKAKAVTFNGAYTASYPLTQNEQDQQGLLFSKPLYQVKNVFFTQKSKNILYDKPKQLKGKVVAIVLGYHIKRLETYFKKGYVQIRPCRTLEQCFELLDKGKVDLVATSQLIGWNTLRRMASLNSANFKTLKKQLEINTLHLVISKNHPKGQQLMDDFNATLIQLEREGIIPRIKDQHIDRLRH